MGVDPGVHGGVAVLGENGFPLFVEAFKPDMTHKELVSCVQRGVTKLLENGGWECFVEKVGYMPRDGGKGANTFGRVDGLIRGALHALNIVVYDAPPMLWQTALNCLSGGNKNVTKKKAMDMFGGRGIKITHSVADALLIASYGQLTLRKQLPDIFR